MEFVPRVLSAACLEATAEVASAAKRAAGDTNLLRLAQVKKKPLRELCFSHGSGAKVLQGCVIGNSASELPWRLKEPASQVPVPDASPEEDFADCSSDFAAGSPAGSQKSVWTISASSWWCCCWSSSRCYCGCRNTFKASFWRCLGNRTRRPEMLRQQSLTMQQNHRCVRRCFVAWIWKRSDKTKQTRAETARIAAEAALKAKISDPFVPTPSASTLEGRFDEAEIAANFGLRKRSLG